MGALASSNGIKIKINLNKKRRDALKKKLSSTGGVVPESHEISPADRVQQTICPSEEPLDIANNDKYEVVNSEDEMDKDILPVTEHDEDDEICEQLIKYFNSTYDSDLQEEIHQVSQEQRLSPLQAPCHFRKA